MNKKLFNSFYENINNSTKGCKHCRDVDSQKSGYKFICSCCKSVYYLGGRK